MDVLSGPKVLLAGEPGTGKTHCLRTLVDCGVKPCVVFMDPSQALLADLPSVAWHVIAPSKTPWQSAIAYAELINTLSMESLSRVQDSARGDYRQAIELYETLARFVDDRTGEDLGEVDSWGPERALCIDGLSATNRMFLALVTGGRSLRSQPEWLVAMDQQMFWLTQLMGLRCTVVIIAHLALEKNEVTGELLRYPLALGTKNAPQIPGMGFDEVILTYRQGTNFLWSNISTQFATKKRLMPMSDKLEPTFVTLFDAWKKKGGTLDDVVPDGATPAGDDPGGERGMA